MKVYKITDAEFAKYGQVVDSYNFEKTINLKKDTNMKKYDLVVVGGGLSGCAAAISAKREGLSVLLIEKTGSLGGAISNNLVFPFMHYFEAPNANGKKVYLSEGIFSEMRAVASSIETPETDTEFRPEAFKHALDKMVVSSGADLLFHTALCDAEKDGDKIKSVKILTKSGLEDVYADYFIDATGDGDLIYYAGCDYQLGRETDSLCQPMTTCFRLSGVDMNQFGKDLPMLQQEYKALKEKGEIKNPRENILFFVGLGEGILHLNTTRVIKHNPTDPIELSKAEVLGREQVFEIVKFLKTHSKAFEKSTVISVANQIGVRESRKLKGLHVLTAEELTGLVYFDDTIARGNYEIDIHNPSGTGTYIHYFKKGEVYQIPYRSLVPKEYVNLLVAGRCLSATHEAHSAVRIMPICACLGQAAGTAVAVAVKTKTNTHTLSTDKVREILKNNGANV